MQHGGCAIHHVGSLATPQLAIIDSFIAKVEKELSDKCAELLALVDHLVKTNPDTQATVFYLKMAGGAFVFVLFVFVFRLCFCCCCCYTHKLTHTLYLLATTTLPCRAFLGWFCTHLVVGLVLCVRVCVLNLGHTDYHRYLAEFKQGSERDGAISNARDQYERAQKAAEDLKQTDPIRLGLALNYSVRRRCRTIEQSTCRIPPNPLAPHSLVFLIDEPGVLLRDHPGVQDCH